jgi:peptide/nickel transport system permease protein
LTSYPLALVGSLLLAITVIPSLVGMFVTPYDPTALDIASRVQPPSSQHLFGTDQFGHDLFSEILAGGHLTLAIGFFPILIALVVGGSIGLLGAHFGGKFDVFVVTAVDIMLSFPAVLLAMVIVASIGGGLYQLMLAIAIAWIPIFARMSRGSTLSFTSRPFVRAAVALGCRESRIVFRHLLPNIAGPMIVLATLALGDAILIGSALSFLGLGPPPPTPEWGSLLYQTSEYMSLGWWLTVFPGVAIGLLVLGFNLLGDGLRDALDPSAQVENVSLKGSPAT